MSSLSAATVREIACALYLKRELAIILSTGERQVIVRPVTKHMVYEQLQCIYNETAPSRSTVSRWLKQLEETQPALVTYARGSHIAMRDNHLRSAQEALTTTARKHHKETTSESLRKHREDQARFIAEIRAQYDRLARTLDSLDGQVVMDVSTGKFILQKKTKEVTMTDDEQQAWSAMIPRKRRPQRLYIDNGQAFSEPPATSDAERADESSIEQSTGSGPQGHGKIERIYHIDHRVLDVFIGHIKTSEE